MFDNGIGINLLPRHGQEDADAPGATELVQRQQLLRAPACCSDQPEYCLRQPKYTPHAAWEAMVHAHWAATLSGATDASDALMALRSCCLAAASCGGISFAGGITASASGSAATGGGGGAGIT